MFSLIIIIILFPLFWFVPGLMMESSSLNVTLEFLRFLLGLWISRLPSSIVSREMRLLWAVLNSVRFWEDAEKERNVLSVVALIKILQFDNTTI